MNSAVVILSSPESASVSDGDVLTMPVARDRTSQVDFLRELSRARRSETAPVTVALEVSVDVPVALRHDDAPVERPWTDGFRSLPTGRTDAGIPDWAAAPLAPSLNPNNWFTESDHERPAEPQTESEADLAAEVPDQLSVDDPLTAEAEARVEPESSPMATWWTSDPGPGLFDIAPELLASPELLVGPGDRTTGDATAGDATAGDPTTGDPTAGGRSAASVLAASLVPPVADPVPVVAASVAVVDDLVRADPEPEPAHEPTVALAPAAIASEIPAVPVVVGATLTNRPPVLDPGAAVVVHCRGLAASRLTRGKSWPVLTGVDLEVRVGEVVVISGRSGAGKTTLLECLAGLHPTESGELNVDGLNVRTASDADLAEVRANAVGFVPQDSELLGDLSAIENIELPLLMHGWSAADARAEAEAAVSLLGLDRPAERPMDLSAGERRRVAIARAIVGEPTILWCDEPTAGLDPETAATIYELLFELCHDGLSIVAVSHDPILLAYATSSYELFNGSLHPVPHLR